MDNIIIDFKFFMFILDIFFGLICFNGGAKEKDLISKRGYMLLAFLLIVSALLIRF